MLHVLNGQSHELMTERSVTVDKRSIINAKKEKNIYIIVGYIWEY